MKYNFIITILCLVVIPAQAAVNRLGGEVSLITGAGGHQDKPSIVLWDDGGMVAWENTNETGFSRIVVQSLNEEYESMGEVRVVSQNLKSIHDLNPKLAKIDKFTSVVVWEAGPRGRRQVYMVLLDRNGLPRGGIQQVNQVEIIGDSQPQVDISDDGIIGIAWISEGRDGEGLGVIGRFYNSDGVPLGNERILNQTTKGNQLGVTIVGLEKKRFMVTWVNEIESGKNESGGIILRSQLMGRFFNASNALQNEFKMGGSDGIVKNPVVTKGDSGVLHVAWLERSQINSRELFNVWSMGINSSTGLPVGVPKKVNDFASGNQKSPRIIHSRGETICIWESMGQDLGGAGIVGKSLPDGVEFVINQQRNLDQYSPAVAVLDNGKAIVVWANTITKDSSIISAQKFSIGNEGLTVAVDGGENEILPAESAGSLPAAAPSLTGPKNYANGASKPGIKPEEEERVIVPKFPQATPKTNPTYANLNSKKVPQVGALRLSNEFTSTSSSQKSGLQSSRLPMASFAARSAIQNLAQFRPRASKNGVISDSNIGRSSSSGGVPTRLSMIRMTEPKIKTTINNNLRFGSNIQRNLGGVNAFASLREREKPYNHEKVDSNLNYASRRMSLIKEQANISDSRARNIEVQAVPASVLSVAGNHFITWNAGGGKRYQIQGSNDKVTWTNYGGIKSHVRGGEMREYLSGKYKYFRVKLNR